MWQRLLQVIAWLWKKIPPQWRIVLIAVTLLALWIVLPRPTERWHVYVGALVALLVLATVIWLFLFVQGLETRRTRRSLNYQESIRDDSPYDQLHDEFHDPIQSTRRTKKRRD